MELLYVADGLHQRSLPNQSFPELLLRVRVYVARRVQRLRTVQFAARPPHLPYDEFLSFKRQPTLIQKIP